MLITKRQLVEATELRLTEVRAALGRGGYPDEDNEIKYSSFHGMTPSGNFVYRIGFEGEDGRQESGNVYLKFVQIDNQFVLEGDY
jgi:hypothetical protein